MPDHECIQLRVIGKIEEFMQESKTIKIQLMGIATVIITQIIVFGFLWGTLTNTVNKNSEYIWGDLTISTRENTRNLDRLMAKLEDIKFIALKNTAIVETPVK
jgi:hypothetical protein